MMRGEIVAAGVGPESGPLSHRWGGLRAADRAVVLAQVSDLLAAGASTLSPVEVLTVVCEVAAKHLSLTNVVFFKRVAGQSRALAWSAPGVSSSSRMAAREQAWSSAAELVDERLSRAGGDDADNVASVIWWNDRLGLSAMLYVESRRTLDRLDRALLDDLLRRMLYLADDDDDVG
jgi:hypothetical protein